MENNNHVSNANRANFITLVGIILCIWVVLLRWKGMVGWMTFTLTLLVALTDFLDGFAARKFNQITRCGAILDRLRDKLYALSHFWFIYASYCGITERVTWVSLIIALLISIASFEAVLFLAGFWGLWRKKEVESNIWGKWKMAFECAVVFSWAFVHDLGFSLASTTSLVLVGTFLFASIILAGKSLGGYWNKYFPNNKCQ